MFLILQVFAWLIFPMAKKQRRPTQQHYSDDGGHDTTSAVNLKEVVPMLNYTNFGWPDLLAPPLERLFLMQGWLHAGLGNVVVLHCKGGRSHIGSVIPAYMHYSNTCASLTENTQEVFISITTGIPLRGDILIKCLHKMTRPGQREVMWQCQLDPSSS